MSGRVLLLLAVLILLVACASPPAATIPPPPEAPQSTAPAGTPPPSRPGEPASTPESALTPTIAYPDSLSSADLHQRLAPLARTADCSLPCYNGLIPGQDGVAETLNFYARLGIGTQDFIPGDYQAVLDGTGRLGAWLNRISDQLDVERQGIRPPLMDVSLQDGVVEYINVGWQYLPGYLELADVLAALGPPSGLDLGVVPGDAPPAVILRLVYPERQTGFMYYSAGLPACFTADQVSVTLFGVFAPAVPIMEGMSGSEVLLPLETTLGISGADFTAQIQAGGCLTLTPEQLAPWQAIGSP